MRIGRLERQVANCGGWNWFLSEMVRAWLGQNRKIDRRDEEESHSTFGTG